MNILANILPVCGFYLFWRICAKFEAKLKSELMNVAESITLRAALRQAGIDISCKTATDKN